MLKEGYEVAAPLVQQGVEAVAPVVKGAVKATGEVALPAVSKAVPVVTVRANQGGWEKALALAARGTGATHAPAAPGAVYPCMRAHARPARPGPPVAGAARRRPSAAR